MNKFAAHSLKAAALIAMAGGAVIGGVAHTSAGAPSMWITANDGCYYLTDDGGQTATDAACPRADGSIDVYVAASGQWFYSQTVGGNVVQQSPVQQSPVQFDPSLTGSWFDSMSTGLSSTAGDFYLDSYLSAVNADIVDMVAARLRGGDRRHLLLPRLLTAAGDRRRGGGRGDRRPVPRRRPRHRSANPASQPHTNDMSDPPVAGHSCRVTILLRCAASCLEFPTSGSRCSPRDWEPPPAARPGCCCTSSPSSRTSSCSTVGGGRRRTSATSIAAPGWWSQPSPAARSSR